MEMNDPEQYRDFSTNLIRWMGRNALRKLRAYEKAGLPFPTIEDLAIWLEGITFPKAEAVMDDTKSKWRTSVEDIEHKALEAATWALENYNPLIYVRAAKGGSKSKRRTTHSLEGLEDLSIAQQATSLGVSLSTVSRLRRAAAAASVSAAEAADKALLDSIDPVEGTRQPEEDWIDAFLADEPEPTPEPGMNAPPIDVGLLSENESKQLIYDEITEMFAGMGVVRLSNGGWHIPDPDPIGIDDVLTGLIDPSVSSTPTSAELDRLLEGADL
ncbi:hypothetical protein OVN18_09510 [Microcella daejeonensis]|uniref:Uncharacterized protein n=1 Tax=Microcella daejeonensis TaxID=2994971 RepID=A0A9E8MJQ6_9MICO|nr:hypothetical protein [Microcella daejeonensis]WAB80802.1 hypothetical protein OVN18_09510 [Microcella daejeonensis]